MAIPRRAILIFSSVTLILIIALSLSTAIELRAPPTKLIQVAVAQGATDATLSADLKGKGRVNGTGFDRGEIWSGTTEISPGAPPSTIHITLDGEPTATTTQDAGPGEGQPTVIVPLPGQASATSMDDEGYIGPSPTAIPAPPAPPAPPKPPSQLPILALTYTSSGGPKHCRGSLLSKLLFPPPSTLYKNGTCIDLPRDARCGVFLADKNDKCEAQLFNMGNCYNSSETYVNTVVFMPEERPVGALWRSMWVRCGVEVEEPGLIDPSVLGGLLKKPGGKGG